MSDSTSNLIRRAINHCKPAFLGGFTFRQWLRLLLENRFDIDAKFLPRAMFATAGSVLTSCLKPLEPDARLDEACESLWRQPVFILGLPRSGTTHLFNLLSEDPQFAFPSRVDCYNAHIFLLLHRLGANRLLGMIPPKKRFMDNVHTGWLSPEEDNIALTILAGDGSRLTQVFQRNETYRDSLGADGGLNERQKTLFTSALIQFSRKLVFLKRARPLFKSPNHTPKIPEILGAFPEAKFVTILRHPFHQFASLKAMQTSSSRTWSALQESTPVTDDRRLEFMTSTLRRYMETRTMIPQGQLCEIHYADLVRKESDSLRHIYSELNLGIPPARIPPTCEQPYRKNNHAPLPEDLQNMIRKGYEPFESLGFFSRDL